MCCGLYVLTLWGMVFVVSDCFTGTNKWAEYSSFFIYRNLNLLWQAQLLSANILQKCFKIVYFWSQKRHFLMKIPNCPSPWLTVYSLETLLQYVSWESSWACHNRLRFLLVFYLHKTNPDVPLFKYINMIKITKWKW